MEKKAIIIIALLALAGCAEKLTPEEQTYKEYCLSHNGDWMKMSELKEGKPTGITCYGCMPDEKNHICALEQYQQWELEFG